MCQRILALLLFFCTGVMGDENPKAQPQTYVIGISPGLPGTVKDDVYRGFVRLLVEGLPLNSTVEVYDALDLRTITRVELPNASVFQSPKTRANQFAAAIRDVKMFLARPPWTGPTKGAWHTEAAIRLPQFVDFLSERSWPAGAQPHLLLIGSPIYEDTKERGFSMVDGYFPSDGHLRATREESIFGFSAETNGSPALVVHWVYFGDPWISELHKEKVTRFWTLYLERRGAQMASFSGDMASVLQSFREKAPGIAAVAKHWRPDPAQTKIEMLRVSRNVEIADWLTRDHVENPATPPGTLVGPMKIGIRWKANIDVDLYATARPGAETLFFQHTRSPEGYYYKDHRSSPGKEYEFIEFENAVDAREVEAFINFYKGDCAGGPSGEVRIEFDGRIYSAPFAIHAEEGNLGRTGKSQDDYWTRVPIREMLKLGNTANRAGL